MRLVKKCANLADGQTAGVERDDLVVKAREAPLVFASVPRDREGTFEPQLIGAKSSARGFS